LLASCKNWLRFVILRGPAGGPLAAGASSAATCCGNWRCFYCFIQSRRQRMGFEPKSARHDLWVMPGAAPPCGLVATAMDFAMVPPAQRDGGLVADLAAQGSVLGEVKMVGVGWLAPADQARRGEYRAGGRNLSRERRYCGWQSTVKDRS
jgi:hypothetical protein